MGRLYPKYAFWIILTLALAVRLAYVLQMDASPLFEYPAVDAGTYAQHAERLAAGNWLGLGEGPFWQPPFYPYFLGLIKIIIPGSFFYAARFIQALLGALVCTLVYWLGQQMFQSRIGAIAALAAVFYGPLIFFDGELLPATLAACLDLAGLTLLVRAVRRPSSWAFLGAGLVFGLAALTVATVLSFVVAGAGWIFWYFRSRGLPLSQALKRAGVFPLGALLAIAPVSLRNHVIGGDTVLISHNAGVNFYIGNNPDYDRTMHIRPGWEWDDLVGMPLKAGVERPSLKSRFFLNKAWEYIRTQPFDYMSLLFKKTFLFWHGDEVGRNQDIYFWRKYSSLLAATLWKWGVAFPFGIVGPLALLGLGLVVRQQGFSLPVVFVGVYALSVIAFFATARYRIPIVPVLLLFAAHGAHWVYTCVQARRLGTAGAGLALLGVFVVLANHQLAPMDVGDAAIHHNLGDAYSKQGRLDQARHEFEQAVALDSTYWQAWINLGSLMAWQKDIPEAIQIFEWLLQAHPEQEEVWLRLARAQRTMRNRPAALRAYQEVLRITPRQRRIYAELIGFHLQARDFDQAEEVLQQALERFPLEEERLRKMYERMRIMVLTR